MLVYKLTFPNGKVYIGQTTRKMETRYRQHAAQARQGNPLPVYAAWRKYGAPDCVQIATCADSAALNAAEIAAIRAHACVSPDGYNVTTGGERFDMHPDTKAKISAVHKGRVLTASHKDKVGSASKERWEDESYREKVATGVTASFTPERRAAIAAATKAAWARRKAEGFVVSEETKSKLKGRVFSAESRAKMSASAKGKPKGPRSEATKAKLSASVKASHDGMKRSEAIRAGHAARTPEQRSEAARKAWATKRAQEK